MVWDIVRNQIPELKSHIQVIMKKVEEIER